MTKKDLIDAIMQELGYTRKDATHFVDLFFEAIKEEIQQKGKIKISKFGSFEVYKKKTRIGRNPNTMKEAPIPERNVVRFKSSSILRKSINR